MDETRSALLKTTGLLVVPAILLIAVPALILYLTGDPDGPPGAWTLAAGCLLALLGVALNLWSVWGFIHIGRGTPMHMAPPRILVIDGPYRYVRNPMYLGFGTVLAGEALALGSWALAGYGCLLLAAFHLLVVMYEEPALDRTFGEAYREYRAAVPGWVPRPGALKSMR